MDSTPCSGPRRSVRNLFVALGLLALAVGCAPREPQAEQEPPAGQGSLTADEERTYREIEAGLVGPAANDVVTVSPCSSEDEEGCYHCPDSDLKGLRVEPYRIVRDCFAVVGEGWCKDQRAKVRWVTEGFEYPITLAIDSKIAEGGDEDADDASALSGVGVYGGVQRDLRRESSGLWSRMPGRLTQPQEDWRYTVTVSKPGGADEYCADPEIRIRRR